ncbi:hypothetical protein CQW49_22375 (plasmid) [Methylosinus trichosporium OB3b]|uniref:HEAT repeat domain-containing protein n=1 Tax=Methylosinus trichosporium (strain ATCC 35070 / NCIMB 11131 / UNIQEM 75 / OB3b) TaxID=595536 RepID=A0A2D2D712_METT3|nr:HEAT repeat domain-containing protein [Methylosinus trichosporium]ATQ70735.1 hypothetical protein CQW49_22375 [Methylosinus trichosporium OB3b]
MAVEIKRSLMEREIRDLVETAVAHIDDPDRGDAFALSPACDAIATLQRNGDQSVFEVCSVLCRSADPRERSVGAAILGQLGYSLELLRDQRFGLLKEMLEREMSGGADPEMLVAICFAFGHLKDPRGVSAVVPLARHPFSSVRFAVAYAFSAQDDPVAITWLIELSNDEEPHVRDWATFALGQQIEADNSEIREALSARLTDVDVDTRLEAISGLARRNDKNVIDHILAALEAGEVGAVIYGAVTDIADPIFCMHLMGTKQSGRELPKVVAESRYLRSAWQAAVLACGCDAT